MTIPWQDVVTVGLVIAALGYLAYRIGRWIRRKGFSRCGCCTKCPAEPTEKPLVTLDGKPRKER